VDPSGNVLLGLSGGLGSVVLVDLVLKTYIAGMAGNLQSKHTGSQKPTGKRERVWKKAYIGYIETCAAYSEQHDRIDQVKTMMNQYPEYELIVMRIEDAFDPSWWSSIGKDSHRVFSVDMGFQGM